MQLTVVVMDAVHMAQPSLSSALLQHEVLVCRRLAAEPV